MKIFIYQYPISYGTGAGIVVSETKGQAIEMLKHTGFSPDIIADLEIKELDISTPTVIDMSYEE